VFGARFDASYRTHDAEPGNGDMLILNPLDGSERSVLVGYGVAVVTVAAALAALLLMQNRWQASVPVSLLLTAVVVTTWLAGTKPGCSRQHLRSSASIITTSA
jgi:uncharacterized membrane protein